MLLLVATRQRFVGTGELRSYVEAGRGPRPVFGSCHWGGWRSACCRSFRCGRLFRSEKAQFLFCRWSFVFVRSRLCLVVAL
jgi:hypothetical protein